eukprot:108306-Amphidinium_carterae.2
MQRAMGYSPAGLHSDLSKAYDGIDHRILQHLLSSAGFPQVFIHMLLDAYAGPKWVDFSGVVAIPSTWRGIPAGDPAAVAAMGIYTWGLVTAVHRANAFIRTFVDDTAIWTTSNFKEQQSKRQQKQLVELVEDWASVHGMDLNSKTNVWGSSVAKTKRVKAESQRHKADCVVRDLGVDLVLTDDGSSRKATQQKRVQEARQSMQKLMWQSWSIAELALAVRTIIFTKAFWGSEIHMLELTVLGNVRKDVTRLLFKKQLFGRNPCLALGVVHETPGLEPVMASCSRVICFWAELLSDTKYQQMIVEAWPTAKDIHTQGQRRHHVLHNLFQALDLVQWKHEGPLAWHTHHLIDLEVTKTPKALLQHYLRDAVHQHCTEQARHRSDFKDLRVTNRQLHKQAIKYLNPEQRNKLAFHQAGGGTSPAMLAGRSLDCAGICREFCPMCNAESGDYTHCLWECPAQPQCSAMLWELLRAVRNEAATGRGMVPEHFNWESLEVAPHLTPEVKLCTFYQELLERRELLLYYTEHPEEGPTHPPAEVQQPLHRYSQAAPAVPLEVQAETEPAAAVALQGQQHVWIQTQTKPCHLFQCQVCQRVVKTSQKAAANNQGCGGVALTKTTLAQETLHKKLLFELRQRRAQDLEAANKHDLCLMPRPNNAVWTTCVRCRASSQAKKARPFSEEHCSARPVRQTQKRRVEAIEAFRSQPGTEYHHYVPEPLDVEQ